MAIQLTPRRFSAAEYHQMIEAGVFGEDERLELIDGEIVQMSPIDDRHAACVRRLNALLVGLVVGRAIVDVENPLMVSADYAPQPDLALLRPRPDHDASRTPSTEDCLLVVEVADTYDRQIKMPRYARAGLSHFWLIDLERDVVVVYRDPVGDSYEHVQVLHRGDELLLPELEATLSVRSVLG